jgi:hypothetical protein
MSRIKALYRSWAIACSGTSVYAPRHRAEWLDKIPEPGVVAAQIAARLEERANPTEPAM